MLILKTYTIPTCPTCLNCLCIFICFFLHPTSIPTIRLLLLHHHYVTLITYLLSWRCAPSTWMSRTSTTRQFPPLVYAHPATYLHFLTFLCLFSPLLPPSACNQVPVIPWGFNLYGYLLASMPLPLPSCVCFTSMNLLLLGLFFRVSVSRKVKGPRRLDSLVVARPGTPPPRYLVTPAPSGSPLPPYCRLDHITLAEFVGARR